MALMITTWEESLGVLWWLSEHDPGQGSDWSCQSRVCSSFMLQQPGRKEGQKCFLPGALSILQSSRTRFALLGSPCHLVVHTAELTQSPVRFCWNSCNVHAFGCYTAKEFKFPLICTHFLVDQAVSKMCYHSMKLEKKMHNAYCLIHITSYKKRSSAHPTWSDVLIRTWLVLAE